MGFAGRGHPGSGEGLRTRAARLASGVLCALAALALAAPPSSASLLAWGENVEGELGTGSHVPGTGMAMFVSGLAEVQSVGAGGTFSLALLGDGSVMAWGSNREGQLGIGNHSGPETCFNPCSRVPVAVSGLGEVTAVAAGASHGLALSGGHVLAWGQGASGELGDGANEESDTPVTVTGVSEASAISAGDGFSLALLANGEVLAWGDNLLGELGNGTFTASNVPVHVSGLSGVRAISARGRRAFALLPDGHVMAWGEGPGRVPVEVGNLSEAVAVSAGGNGGIALLANGHVVSITAGKKPGAVEVPGLSEVTAIASAGADFALLADGTVQAWGSGESGQLGGGNPWPSNSGPHGVCGVSGATAVYAGGSNGFAYLPAGEPAAPTLLELAPDDGPLGGGEGVLVRGRRLSGTESVTFGGSSVPFKVISDAELEATSPAGEAPVEVRVTTPSGTSIRCPADEFRFEPAPSVTKVSPRSGTVAGGTHVFVTGRNFTLGEVSFHFGSAPASSVRRLGLTSTGETKIEAVSPSMPAGVVAVTATDNGGTSALTSADTFKVLPVITGLSPAEGPAAGGNEVIVNGAGFLPGAGTATIKFATARGTHVNCPSTTECTVTAPAHAPGAVKVIVTVNGVNAIATYTYR